MTKIGVFGCGKIAEKHLAAYSRIDGVEVVATDLLAAGEEVAATYGAGWCADPDALLSDDSLDAIDVCVPTPAHAPLILPALESGKHVFCEKPLASNLAEAEAIQEAASRAGRHVMVGYLYRFHPGYRLVKAAIDAGTIGEPYLGFFRLGGRGSHRPWKHRADAGGGAANEMLVHALDMILWCFGRPREVEVLTRETVLSSRVIGGEQVPTDAEDFLLLRLEMDNGARVFCQSDLITPAYMNHFEVSGENGTLFTSIMGFMPTFVFCREGRNGQEQGHNFHTIDGSDLFLHEMGHFVDCIRNGTSTQLNTIEESLEVMRVMEAVR